MKNNKDIEQAESLIVTIAIFVNIAFIIFLNIDMLEQYESYFDADIEYYIMISICVLTVITLLIHPKRKKISNPSLVRLYLISKCLENQKAITELQSELNDMQKGTK